MKAALPWLLILLVIWLLIRSSRKENVPAWARVVQLLLIFGVVAIGLYYGSFRVERAKAEVKRSRETAKMLVETMEEYETGKGVLSAIAMPFGADGLVDATEVVVDLLNRGEISTLKKAADHAQYCLADVERDPGLVELVMFSQPAACKVMFQTLGEPGDLTAAGVTFENVAKRATSDAPPGAPGGPACGEWEIRSIQADLPKTKKSGNPWDVADVPPDPYFMLKIGSGKRMKSPRAKDQYELVWKPKSPIKAGPGSTLEVQVYDADLIDDDFAFGWEAKVPTNISSSWLVGQHPNGIEFSMSCRASSSRL